MTRVIDVVRSVLVSPETAALLFTFLAYIYWPAPYLLLATQVGTDLKSGAEIAAFPLSLIGLTYSLSSDLLSPQGARKRLLDWPDYWMLKVRVVVALAFCAMCLGMSLVGWYLMAAARSLWGSALIVAGYFCGSVTLSTVGLARWRARELLGE